MAVAHYKIAVSVLVATGTHYNHFGNSARCPFETVLTEMFLKTEDPEHLLEKSVTVTSSSFTFVFVFRGFSRQLISGRAGLSLYHIFLKNNEDMIITVHFSDRNFRSFYSPRPDQKSQVEKSRSKKRIRAISRSHLGSTENNLPSHDHNLLRRFESTWP